MGHWQIFLEPALVTIGGIWGIWYLSRPGRHALKGRRDHRVMIAAGAFSKSHKPMQRAEIPYMGEWKKPR